MSLYMAFALELDLFSLMWPGRRTTEVSIMYVLSFHKQNEGFCVSPSSSPDLTGAITALFDLDLVFCNVVSHSFLFS